jgi:RNase P/RNase MRP subunit p30
VLVSNFEKAKEKLKKKIRAGTGLEVQVAQARALDAANAAKWLAQVEGLYRFCKLARCQLVITSGATSQWGMVSGRSFDALLKECGIEPARYWQELERWLKSRLERRVTA